MSDKSHPTTDNEEEMNLEDEARLARRYHLGAVAEASAIMESVLRAIFSSLLGSPRANVVAAGQPVSWLIDNALAVIDANDEVRGPSLGEPDNVARFRAAIASCRDLNTRRNRLIHGAWVDGLPNGHPGQSVLHSKWRQPWPFAIEISLDDIENLVVDLEVAVNDLMMAIFNVKGIIAGT
ncbi:MAG: hypothetical protein ABSG24_07980 [Acidimicrobiales bacterium]|jgi:hypothetical protein